MLGKSERRRIHGLILATLLHSGGPLLMVFLAERPTPTTRQVSSGGPPPQVLRDPGQPHKQSLPMLSRERKHADRLQEMTTPSPTQHPAGPASRRSSPSSASSTTGSPSCWEPTSAPCMSATASGCRRPWR